VIRVLIVDDHAAVRAGLHTVLRLEPGLVPVGAATGEAELLPLLEQTHPNVVLLDHNLPGRDGVQLCRRIKARPDRPAVLMYTAYDSTELALPATLAGADGVIEKRASADELFDAIRLVARGRRSLPPISRDVLARASRRIEERDVPLLELLIGGAPPAEIAEALAIAVEDLEPRVEGLLMALRIDTGSSPCA